MKKYSIIMIAALTVAGFSASKMNIHNSDGTTTIKYTDEIDSITFTPIPTLLTDQDEKTIGLKYQKYLNDSLQYQILSPINPVSVWVDSLGKAIAKQQDRPNFTYTDFTFTVINEDIVDAFSFPGGYINIYMGLINKTATVDQIAGVIAHEIGHISNQHYKEQLVKTTGMDEIQKMVLGDNSSLAANFSKYLVGLKMSRNNEFEADSLSIDYIAKDGKLSLWGIKNFLDTLVTMESSNPEILTVHSIPQIRADNVKSIIEQQYPIQSKIPDGMSKPIFR